MKENAGAIFGALLLDIRRNDPERWARIRARGAEIDALRKVGEAEFPGDTSKAQGEK